MSLSTPIENIQLLAELLEQNPTADQVIIFLGYILDPIENSTLVNWINLGKREEFENKKFFGFDSKSNSNHKISLLSEDEIQVAARTQKIMLFNLINKFEFHKNLSGEIEISKYATSLVIPIRNEIVLQAFFAMNYTKMKEFSDYFECIRTLLAIWHTRLKNTDATLTKDKIFKGTPLTPRQSQIVELIKEGNTNYLISVKLGFSESLIRQETIVIYRKLEVTGRKELRKDFLNQAV